MCRVLLELGASLDAADDNGQKAIHLAAQADQVRLSYFVELLRLIAFADQRCEFLSIHKCVFLPQYTLKK